MIAAVAMVVGGCGPVLPAAIPVATFPVFPGNGVGSAPLLVDAGWLRARQQESESFRVLDVSSWSVYRAGHIPGASHVWWQDTVDRFYPVYGVVLSERQNPGARVRLLANLGVDDGAFVVAYDDNDNRDAARLVWVLRFFGHERAAVLDGGLAAWRGMGGEVSRRDTPPPRVASATIALQPGFVIGTRELSRRLDDPKLVIVDVRTSEETADDLNGTIRSGRIPGAISFPWRATMLGETGRLRSVADLTTDLRVVGVTPDKEIVVYARFGGEAAHTWLVLKLLDYPSVRVYDQGWAEWAAKPELPVSLIDESFT